MELFVVAAASLGIGVALGVSGYGGFLVPPLLLWTGTQSDPRGAVLHALLAGLVPAVIGAVGYRRHHGTPWGPAAALALSAVPGVLLGRWAVSVVPAGTLSVVIGVSLVAVGTWLLVDRGRGAARAAEASSRGPDGALSTSRRRLAVVLLAGLLAGAAAVVVGIGGPLITTPVLVAGGVPLATAVGAGLASSVVAGGLGALSLSGVADVEPVLLVVVAVPQLVGVAVGVRLHARVDAGAMRLAVAAVAVVAGCGFASGMVG